MKFNTVPIAALSVATALTVGACESAPVVTQPTIIENPQLECPGKTQGTLDDFLPQGLTAHGLKLMTTRVDGGECAPLYNPDTPNVILGWVAAGTLFEAECYETKPNRIISWQLLAAGNRPGALNLTNAGSERLGGLVISFCAGESHRRIQAVQPPLFHVGKQFCTEKNASCSV